MFWRWADCITLSPVCSPEIRSYRVWFADAVCCLFVPDVFLLVVSCCVTKVTWGASNVGKGKLAERACSWHVATEDLTCYCPVTERNNHITISHFAFLSSSFHHHVMLVSVWVSKFRGAGVCPHVRLSVAHKVLLVPADGSVMCAEYQETVHLRKALASDIRVRNGVRLQGTYPCGRVAKCELRSG